MQALILEAEGDPVGDYIIDLFDMHLHNVLEGDDELERTANEINNIEWAEYPPAQFMPSPEVIEIMDGAIFYNKVRTGIENEGHAEFSNARLGDVFLAPSRPHRQQSPRALRPRALDMHTSSFPRHATCCMATLIASSFLKAGCYRIVGNSTPLRHSRARQS